MLGLYDNSVQDSTVSVIFIRNSRLRDRWGNRVRLLRDVNMYLYYLLSTIVIPYYMYIYVLA